MQSGLRRIAALLTPLLLAAIGLLAAWEWRESIESLQEGQTLEARVLAEHAARSLDAAAQAGSQLIDGWRHTPPNPKQLKEGLRLALAYQPGVRAVSLLDLDGRIVASTLASEVGLRIALQPLLVGRSPSSDTWLGPVQRARSLSDLVPGARAVPAGISLLPLIQEVNSAGAQRLLVTQLNTDSFATFQTQTIQKGSTHAALLSLQGRLVAGMSATGLRDESTWRELPAFEHFLPEREAGIWQGEGLRQGSQFVAFRLTPRWPLLAWVETRHDDAFKAWWSEGGMLVMAVALAALLSIGALLVTARIQAGRQSALIQRDQAEVKIQERDEALASIVGSLQETVLRTDAEGKLQFASDRAEMLWGQALDQLIGKPIWELVEAPERYRLRSLLRAEMTRERSGDESESPLHRMLVGLRRQADNSLRHIDLSLRAVRRAGLLVGFAGSAVDASARVQAQRSLEAQLAFLQQVLEVSPLPTSVFDIHRRYIFVNQAWERFTGRERDDVLGTEVGQALDASQRALHESMDQELLTSGRPLRYDAQLRRVDNSLRDVIVIKLLLPGDSTHGARIMAKLLDVTELRDAERATRDARDAAEEASRAKSEFVANISHELRTPLQSIIGFSELGELRSGAQPRLQAMFGDIHGAGQRMLSLVNDLLDVAKLDSAIGAIHLERTELRGLIRSVSRELEPLLDAKQLVLHHQFPEQTLLLSADPLRLQQVVRNLLANAIKFSPAAGEIRVQAEATNGLLSIRILDRGPGIPQRELERIFEAFSQSSLTNDGSGGTGLGLTISRKIIEAHGGRLWAENRAQGGACFCVELPQRPQDRELTQPMPL